MSKGKIYVVGIGPGNYENMTLRAIKALEESDCIAGYTVYCDLVRDKFPDKEYIQTPMMGEEKRVELALEAASNGKIVSIICSGDPGVYGMAGLALSKVEALPDMEVEVIPGVSAAFSGAALLGAPLIHDFSVISLSDRLTPMDLIEKRLRLAAQGDMAIVLYNPQSKSRSGYLAKAYEVLAEYIEPERVCGIAWNIGRQGQRYKVFRFSCLKDIDADMFSTVFIGNSRSREILGRMVTSRGYDSEK